jgi:hypothetical protein
VYWLSPLDLTYYLGATAYRVVDVIVFVAVAASVHLGCILAPLEDPDQV